MNIASHRRRSSWLIAVAIGTLSVSNGLMLRAQVAAPPAPAGEQVFNEGDVQPAAPAPAVELKTLAVIAFNSYDNLMNDVKYLGSLTGRNDATAMVEGRIAQMTGGKGLAGLDKTKPWGLIVQTDGMQFLPVVCLPVTNADELLGVVTGMGIDVQDGGGGMKRLALPGGRTALVKSDGGWTYIAQNPAALTTVPKDTQTTLANLLSESDVAATIAAQNLPTMYRQLAILTLQSSMQQQLRRQPKETNEEFLARQKVVKAQMEQTVRQIQELDSIAFNWLVDAQQERSVMEFTYGFQAGGTMAKQLAAYNDPHTNFAGFYQPDAAATVSFATKADPQALQQDVAQFQSVMRGARTQFDKSVDESDKFADEAQRAAVKAAASDWFDAFEETISAGQIDGGAALHTGSDSMTFVAGGVVKDPAKIESGLKKLEAGLQKSEKFSGIKWNAASHAGVNFHTMTVPVPETDAGLNKLLGGQAEMAVGIGQEAVYLAVGKDNMAAINRAIDGSIAEPNKAVPPFELALSVGPLLEMAAAQSKDDAERERILSAANLVRNEALGRDHLRVVLQVVPNGLRYHIEAEEGVLKAAGKAAADAHQRRAAAQ